MHSTKGENSEWVRQRQILGVEARFLTTVSFSQGRESGQAGQLLLEPLDVGVIGR